MFSSQFIQLYIVLSDINVRNFLVFSYIFASQFTHFCHKFIYICTSQFTHFLTNSSQHYTQFSTLLFVYFSTLLESILKSGLLSSALLAGKNLVGIVGVGIVGVGIIAPTHRFQIVIILFVFQIFRLNNAEKNVKIVRNGRVF